MAPCAVCAPSPRGGKDSTTVVAKETPDYSFPGMAIRDGQTPELKELIEVTSPSHAEAYVDVCRERPALQPKTGKAETLRQGETPGGGKNLGTSVTLARRILVQRGHRLSVSANQGGLEAIQLARGHLVPGGHRIGTV